MSGKSRYFDDNYILVYNIPIFDSIFMPQKPEVKPHPAPKLPKGPIFPPEVKGIQEMARWSIYSEEVKKLLRLCEHPLSADCPVNPFVEHLHSNYSKSNEDLVEKEYEKYLDDYGWVNADEKEYEAMHPEQKKRDGDKYGFYEGEKGWKFHLNILPKDTMKVSTYLKREGYHHKFLNGGALNDGKIFTIYIGSRKLAEKLSKKISKALAPYLCRPVDKKEIEFARGVVGRFAVGGNQYKFTQYGNYGIPEIIEKIPFSLRKSVSLEQRNFLWQQTGISQEDLFNKAVKTYIELKKLYGEYFA